MIIKAKAVNGVIVGWQFYCPACDNLHWFEVPRWGFDGNEAKPTFTPSLRLYYTHPKTKADVTICHLFVKAGKIEYCSDCPHNMAGKTIGMVPLDPDQIAD